MDTEHWLVLELVIYQLKECKFGVLEQNKILKISKNIGNKEMLRL